MRKFPLQLSQAAPWFNAPCTANPKFQFDTVAGRYVVLCFFHSAADPTSRKVLDDVLQHRHIFDDTNVCFFGVSTDPADESEKRVEQSLPGVRYFWDFDYQISRLYGAVGEGDNPAENYRPHTLVLDERLRTLAVLPFDDQPETHMPRLMELLANCPSLGSPEPASVQAPILVLPRIFEPELCSALVKYYQDHGGAESGFMREVEGKTVLVHDHGHKRRRDQSIDDADLRAACMHRIHDRLVSEIHKAFQFTATRIERYIVACYDSESEGHFRAHRDNQTKGTAHRRFAVSLNLNTGDYEGGNLRFPEFGRHIYCAPRGGAVVFSCSLLHEATPVTKGCRYAFLPFLYDEEGAKIREENRRFVSMPS